MDDFVRGKLTEWGLSQLIDRFQDQGIDEESLYCLKEKDIDDLIKDVGPKAKFREKLRLLKDEERTDEQTGSFSVLECEEAAALAQELPSTSDKGKRKLNPHGEASIDQSPSKRRVTGLKAEEVILHDVKHIMEHVNHRLKNQHNTRLNDFLRKRISTLETDKRELVGVFGKTGAGKSSLINAIIGVKGLLPSGRVNACTSVMIKVEENRHSSKYEAEIEFITEEEWKDELWSSLQFLGDNGDPNPEDNDDNDDRKDNDDRYSDTVEKLSALYGGEWEGKSHESLMDDKNFKEIPEFLQSRRRILSCESAQELSAKLVKFTRSDSTEEEGTGVKKWYWPLVKCVTVKVPNNDLLQHVTLVDIPGNGDRNKSRAEIWKEIVGSCSTVWIVTEITRAAYESEAWEILERASSLMGNGGECRNIHFICTKSDYIGDSDIPSAEVPAFILKINTQAKKKVNQEFSKQVKIKKHFREDCFNVFTVSSKEFLKSKYLKQDDTEIPKLQDFLKSLNDRHSVTLNYVSGAIGILSLIQGACSNNVADQRRHVCTEFENNITHQLGQVKSSMEEAYKTFERCLDEGVKNSKSSRDKKLETFLNPVKKSGRGFYKTLKSVVENGGAYKPKKGKEINLNLMLSSCLTDSIDEDFRNTFPNEVKCGPFNGAIMNLSFGTESLIESNKNVELHLRFLKTEEDNLKIKLIKTIRCRKKEMYRSLTETIEASMRRSYKRAAGFKGQDTLKNMRNTVMTHFNHSKNFMFDEAKDTMLRLLHDLKEDILKKIEETMMESLEISLRTDDDSIQDVSTELKMVKQHYDQLQSSSDEDVIIIT